MVTGLFRGDTMRILFCLSFLLLLGAAGCGPDPAPRPTTGLVGVFPSEQRGATPPPPSESGAPAVVTGEPSPIPIPTLKSIQEPGRTATPFVPSATPAPGLVAPPGMPTPDRPPKSDPSETPAANLTGTPRPTLPLATLPAPDRETAPAVAVADIEELVSGNTAFALDLYQTLSESGGNLFYSPYSISLALAMAYGGAAGETETQMAETLSFHLPQEQLHAAFNALDQELAPPSQEKEGGGFELSTANSVWWQEGHGFRQDYLDTLASNYGGKVRDVNFWGQPDSARIRINAWVSEETDGRIEDLIPSGAIDRFTRLVLANAVFFKAEWRLPFDARVTSGAPFYGLDGGEIRVDTMRQTENFAYNRGDGYQAVELPYVDSDMSMVILLPDAGAFADIERSLDVFRLDEILERLETRRVRLTMPKFELDASLELADTLEEMGMPNAFDDRKAEFQGMDGLSCLAGDDECLLISDVVHKAFVSVDEAGTEAAAATAVIVGITRAVPSEPIELTIDRPFIFLIRDRETGTILFLGRVINL